jgi:hypothetical protein
MHCGLIPAIGRHASFAAIAINFLIFLAVPTVNRIVFFESARMIFEYHITKSMAECVTYKGEAKPF